MMSSRQLCLANRSYTAGRATDTYLVCIAASGAECEHRDTATPRTLRVSGGWYARSQKPWRCHGHLAHASDMALVEHVLCVLLVSYIWMVQWQMGALPCVYSGGHASGWTAVEECPRRAGPKTALLRELANLAKELLADFDNMSAAT